MELRYNNFNKNAVEMAFVYIYMPYSKLIAKPGFI